MSTPVQLYIYDLSDGIAGQLSLQLTGRQIDGIWHTSIVVYNKEIFYGQGIIVTEPGKSQHGSPIRIVDMGKTDIDEQTFDEYIDDIRERYTPDNYHLLDFNCNTFTNECIGFLTGGSLPSYIKSLPSDFLSTRFGAALRPTIDAMFASRSAANGSARGPAPAMPAIDTPLTASMHFTTDPASFESLLRSHRAVVAFFTSATCGPCRMIEPAFEELAKSKSRSNGVGFAKIDLSVGMGGVVANQYQVRATPTFIFFLDGSKTNELMGVNAPELRTQVDLLIYTAFPPHAHRSLSLPAVEAISLQPILFTQVSKLDTILAKLTESIDGVREWGGAATQAQVKQTLSETILPFLKAPSGASGPSFEYWPALTASLVTNLKASELFPFVDMWRIALLNERFATWCAVKSASQGPMKRLMGKAVEQGVARNYMLTVLRMVANTFSNEVLAREVILFTREEATRLLVDGLLHEDGLVRTAAASLGFNIAAHLQRLRTNGGEGAEENEDWEVEIVAGVVDAIGRETNQDTVHRLVACLGLLLRLSPYTESLAGLLEALQARQVLQAKDVANGEAKHLVLEVSDKLCP